jgi:UDP-N-acetyl-D-mannosaminuronate dehydrogenase
VKLEIGTPAMEAVAAERGLQSQQVAVLAPVSESLALQQAQEGAYDAIILAVNHQEYLHYSEADFQALLKDQKGVFVDVKGIYRNQIKELEYWSL